MRFSRFLAFCPYPLCAIAIAALSLMPLPPMATIDLHSHDKIEHGIAYLVLGALGSSFFARLGRTRVRAAAISITIGLALGVGVELLQPLVGRTRELGDVLANLTGLIAGSAFFLLLSSRRAKIRPV